MLQRRYVVSLAIPKQEMLRYYRGEARSVSAVSSEGQRVRFPATLLRPHMQRDGVCGIFELCTDSEFRLRSFRRLQ